MIYLYSAWSHDLNNRDFVRVIILFLERGKLNLKYLKPFYEFAYRKFGSTLSSASGYLNETAAEAPSARSMKTLIKKSIKSLWMGSRSLKDSSVHLKKNRIQSSEGERQ